MLGLAGALAARSGAAGAVAAVAVGIDGAALAATGLDAGLRSDVVLSGGAGARLEARAESALHVALTRQGLGDLVVAASAARGMALEGSATALGIARAAADPALASRVAGTAATVIEVDFAGREMGSAGRAAAAAVVTAVQGAAALAPALAVRAFAAPPALRRTEPPRVALSGRLMPSNSGRILRG